MRKHAAAASCSQYLMRKIPVEKRGVIHGSSGAIRRTAGRPRLAFPESKNKVCRECDARPRPMGDPISIMTIYYKHAIVRFARGSFRGYYSFMDISVKQFRANCLRLIRRVETVGEAVDIKRRGKVVARLAPPSATSRRRRKPWERLRGSGELSARPGESVLSERDFEAYR